MCVTVLWDSVRAAKVLLHDAIYRNYIDATFSDGGVHFIMMHDLRKQLFD